MHKHTAGNCQHCWDSERIRDKIAASKRKGLWVGGNLIPWRKPPSKKSRQMLLPHNVSRSDVRPEQFERRARLASAIARGRRCVADHAAVRWVVDSVDDPIRRDPAWAT